MPLSGYSRRRRRGHFGLAVAKWGAVLVVLGVAGALVYDFGRGRGEADIDRLEGTVNDLRAERQALAAENERLAQALEAERRRLADLEQAYQRDLPRGPLRELMALIDRRLAEGLAPAGLAAVIAAAEPARQCAGALERKRLRVGLDGAASGDGLGTFADGALTLRISGVAARTAEGDAHAWFDAAKPVSVQIVRPGGRNERWQDVLPLHPVIRIGNDEFRLTIAAADVRGLVQVAVQRCWPS